MKKTVLAAIIIAMCIFAGCGEEDTPANSHTQVTPLPDVTGSPSDEGQEGVPTREPITESGKMMNGEKHPITERTEVNGQMQSYLTGEWKDVNVVKRRNFAIMIPNNKLKVPGENTSATVPQHGISYASIIYEAPVEGRITRLMAIFEDYDDLDKIGPVRSSRDYYVYEAMAYDSIYCNWGLAVPYVAPVINTDRIDNVSVKLEGIDVGADEAFGRGLNSGYDKEFTSSMNIEGYNKAVSRLKYATTYEAHGRFQQAFTFADEGYIATYEGYPDATVIYPGGTTSNKGGYGSNSGANAIRFEYNKEDGLYYRYQYGAPQIDVDNNEQLAVANVVFKICHGEVRDNHDYLTFGVHGNGKAYVFTNGKVIEGTWKRKSDYEANIFCDMDGNEIVFNQGKTWICCIWEEYSEYMLWENKIALTEENVGEYLKITYTSKISGSNNGITVTVEPVSKNYSFQDVQVHIGMNLSKSNGELLYDAPLDFNSNEREQYYDVDDKGNLTIEGYFPQDYNLDEYRGIQIYGVSGYCVIK